MAAAPVKSQPLHNFPLSFVKWGKQNRMNNHRFRRSDHPPLPPPPPDYNHPIHNRSSSPEPDADGGFKSDIKMGAEKIVAGPRAARNRFGSFASCSLIDKPQKQALDGERSVDVGNEDEPSTVQKPWNLRPRRGVSKGVVEIGGCGGGSRNGELQETVAVVQQSEGTTNVPKSMRLRGIAEVQGVEKREKKEKKSRLWISLSKEEIEEDVFVMTGSKPSRRPKKRPRSVQKQLDNVFPGLWLAGVSANDYRVPDAPAMR